MAKKAKTPRLRQPTDLTLRNLRALRRSQAEMQLWMHDVLERLVKLEKLVGVPTESRR